MAAVAAPIVIIYPCEKYEIEAKKLFDEVEKAETLAEIRELFKNFAKIYTVIPDLWNIWIEKEGQHSYKDYDEHQSMPRQNNVKTIARKQFYCKNYCKFNLETFKANFTEYALIVYHFSPDLTPWQMQNFITTIKAAAL